MERTGLYIIGEPDLTRQYLETLIGKNSRKPSVQPILAWQIKYIPAPLKVIGKKIDRKA
jgi:hypothetical protein